MRLPEREISNPFLKICRLERFSILFNKYALRF
jgi:hypothetical protein